MKIFNITETKTKLIFNSIRMKSYFFIILLNCFLNSIYAQSKKEQIQNLNTYIDSLKKELFVLDGKLKYQFQIQNNNDDINNKKINKLENEFYINKMILDSLTKENLNLIESNLNYKNNIIIYKDSIIKKTDDIKLLLDSNNKLIKEVNKLKYEYSKMKDSLFLFTNNKEKTNETADYLMSKSSDSNLKNCFTFKNSKELPEWFETIDRYYSLNDGRIEENIKYIGGFHPIKGEFFFINNQEVIFNNNQISILRTKNIITKTFTNNDYTIVMKWDSNLTTGAWSEGTISINYKNTSKFISKFYISGF
jgi:hypothetical protein